MAYHPVGEMNIEMKYYNIDNNEEAVSTIIEIILVVAIIAILIFAIIVILGAVTAVFVFGMADEIQSDDIQPTHLVYVTSKLVTDTSSDEDKTEVVLTFQGGENANQLTSLHVTIFDDKGDASVITDNGVSGGTVDIYMNSAEWTPGSIGATKKLTVAKDPSRVLVVGKFTDGAEQVVLDKSF